MNSALDPGLPLPVVKDTDFLSMLAGLADRPPRSLALLRRGGRFLLALPEDREAARRTLDLYQPQRWPARSLVAGLKVAVGAGLHGKILERFVPAASGGGQPGLLEGALPESLGVLLGNPEHRIRRALLSYRTSGGWEVAKVFLGSDGAAALEREATVLAALGGSSTGVPAPVRYLQAGEAAVLRMPYLSGRKIRRGETAGVLDLLESWVLDQPPQALGTFPEWNPIRSALAPLEGGDRALNRLSAENLVPVTRHGDFARWNLLRRPDGGLLVLDWEWGLVGGLPGVDLVHFYGQDARLVSRLPDQEAVGKIASGLQDPASAHYLHRTGWSGGLAAMLACFAFKQGEGHQDNRGILSACLAAFLRA